MCECAYGFGLNGEACEAQGKQLYQVFWIISTSLDIWKSKIPLENSWNYTIYFQLTQKYLWAIYNFQKFKKDTTAKMEKSTSQGLNFA